MLAQDVADSLVRRIEKLQSDGRVVELCLTDASPTLRTSTSPGS
jgi:hypothetical protein